MSKQADTNSIYLSYRRIYILPTKRGFGFLLLIALLMLIAFIYNNNLVYLLSFLLASLFFITILHTVKSLAGLTVSKGHSPNVFVGELAEGRLTIHNPSNTQRYSVQLGLDKHAAMQLVDIPAKQKRQVSLPQPATKRGWFTLTNPVIYCDYPFGLFRAWHRLHLDINALIYPRPSLQECPLPENASSLDAQGNAQKGQDDFYGLQAYQAGDSIRHIHWRALAKGQGLYTRQYSGAQSAEIWLDYEHTMGAEQEERLSQMCRWILEADTAGIAYGFKLAGLSIEPSVGTQHSKQCLEALALF